jgi:hypothetical protein
MYNRYKRDCIAIAILSNRQLNLKKNSTKPNFEDMSFSDILKGMRDEIAELQHEYPFNVTRCFEELGDVAAYVVGMYAHLREIRRKNKDDN